MILTVGPTTARTTATRTMKVDTVIASSTFELTIDSITAGALGYFNSILKKIAKANPRNAGLLCELMIAEYNERNLKIRSRLTHIKIICLFKYRVEEVPLRSIVKNGWNISQQSITPV